MDDYQKNAWFIGNKLIKLQTPFLNNDELAQNTIGHQKNFSCCSYSFKIYPISNKIKLGSLSREIVYGILQSLREHLKSQS